MTVKQLIEELQKRNPGETVLLAKDAEGNDFSPLHEVTWCVTEGVHVGHPSRDKVSFAVLWPSN